MTEAKKKTDAAKPKKAAAKKSVKKGAAISNPVLYDVIVRPVITEKSTLSAEQGKVQFVVRPEATKPLIKQAVEALFGVTVTAVNTMVVKGKTRRFRGIRGQRSDVKKAIVTLKEGDAIDIAAGVK